MDETVLNATDHANFLETVLEVFGRTTAHVAAVVADNSELLRTGHLRHPDEDTVQLCVSLLRIGCARLY